MEEGKDKTFWNKHVYGVATRDRVGSADKAMMKSCERNMNPKIESTDANAVLFGQQHGTNDLKLTTPLGGENDRCGGYFYDLFVCKDVPNFVPMKNIEEDCIKKWNPTRPCKSCKKKVKTNMFYVEILKDSGHLEYQKAYYNGPTGWVRFDSSQC